MSINVNQDGATRSFGMRLTTTSATAVFTATAKMAPLVLGINVANSTGSAVTTTIEWFDSSASTSFAILSSSSLAATSRLILDDIPIAMDDGDEIRVTAGTADAIDVIVTAMVRFGRMG